MAEPPSPGAARGGATGAGRVLAVAGGKGGCGKTATTLGLATAAAARHGAATGHGAAELPAAAPAVLAVDADCGMADLHRVAGVERRPALGDGPPAEVARQPPGRPGVGVIPAPVGETRLPPTALARCRAAADRTFVDCPAGAGPDAATPVRLADAAVVVTTLEPASLRDAARTAAMARALGTPLAGAVVSRAADVPDAVADLLAAPALAAVPVAADPVDGPRARAAYDRAVAGLAGSRSP